MVAATESLVIPRSRIVQVQDRCPVTVANVKSAA